MADKVGGAFLDMSPLARLTSFWVVDKGQLDEDLSCSRCCWGILMKNKTGLDIFIEIENILLLFSLFLRWRQLDLDLHTERDIYERLGL